MAADDGQTSGLRAPRLISAGAPRTVTGPGRAPPTRRPRAWAVSRRASASRTTARFVGAAVGACPSRRKLRSRVPGAPRAPRCYSRMGARLGRASAHARVLRTSTPGPRTPRTTPRRRSARRYVGYRATSVVGLGRGAYSERERVLEMILTYAFDAGRPKSQGVVPLVCGFFSDLAIPVRSTAAASWVDVPPHGCRSSTGGGGVNR